MKFLIAGLGSIGRRHLRHLVALGQEDILLYRTHRGTLPDDELSGYLIETDLSAALNHKPDAVIISNPTSLHLDVAIPAVEAGCHILLEKPVSHNLDCLDELQAIVEKKGIHVLVGFQFRYHPSLHQVEKILSGEKIGRSISFRAHWGEFLPDWHPWEDYRRSYSARKDLGGGVILTLAHPLDYLGWFFGEVEALWAFAGQLSDLELNVEDTAEIGLKFVNSVIGSVHLDYNQRPSRHQLEIICTRGTILWDNLGKSLDVYSTEKQEWQPYPLPSDFERDQLFRAQMMHFLEVVEGNADPICTLQDGVRALKLALAVRQSAEEGQRITFHG
ncbi:MAG: Gfo/Idh/MocA family oxidoreductase [Chloroflexota bacterium]|nr:MAG: Gfo/Idh/MocA family oxidoreductase [Chloroflexota bacterium]